MLALPRWHCAERLGTCFVVRSWMMGQIGAERCLHTTQADAAEGPPGPLAGIKVGTHESKTGVMAAWPLGGGCSIRKVPTPGSPNPLAGARSGTGCGRELCRCPARLLWGGCHQGGASGQGRCAALPPPHRRLRHLPVVAILCAQAVWVARAQYVAVSNLGAPCTVGLSTNPWILYLSGSRM